MNDPTPHIDKLILARDRLAEARRYVRTQPNAARNALDGAAGEIGGMIVRVAVTDELVVYRGWDIIFRSCENIDNIISAVGVDPDAAIGGIDLVRHELAILMSGLRRKWAQEGRDRGTAK